MILFQASTRIMQRLAGKAQGEACYTLPVMPLAKSRAYLPNWAVATILAGFVGGTYYYSMRAVGSDDLEKELARENERQRRRQEGEQ